MCIAGAQSTGVTRLRSAPPQRGRPAFPGSWGWSELRPGLHRPCSIGARGSQVCISRGPDVHPALSAATAAVGLCAHLRVRKLRSGDIECWPHSSGSVEKLGLQPLLSRSKFPVVPQLGRPLYLPGRWPAPLSNSLSNKRTNNQMNPRCRAPAYEGHAVSSPSAGIWGPPDHTADAHGTRIASLCSPIAKCRKTVVSLLEPNF